MSQPRIQADQYGDLDELFQRVEEIERRNATSTIGQQPRGGFKTPFIRSSSGGGVSANTQTTVPLPSPLVAGDVILGIVTVNSSSSGAINFINQGFAVSQQLDAPTSTRTHLIWKKVVDADIGASLTVGWPNVGPIAVAMVAIADADWRHSLIDAFEGAGIASNPAPSQYPLPQLTTRTDNDLIVYLIGHGNGTVLTAPPGTTSVVQGRGALGNSDRTSAIFTETLAAAGVTPARTIVDPNAGGFTVDAAEVYSVAIRGVPANVVASDIDNLAIPANHFIAANGGVDVALPNTSVEADFQTANGARFFLVVATGNQKEEWEFLANMMARADSPNDTRVRTKIYTTTALQGAVVTGGPGNYVALSQAQRLYLGNGPLQGWSTLFAQGRAILAANTTYLVGCAMSSQGGSFGAAYYRGDKAYVNFKSERKG